MFPRTKTLERGCGLLVLCLTAGYLAYFGGLDTTLWAASAMTVVGLVATYSQPGETLDYTPATAVTAGDVIQLPDGRAAVPANDIAAGVKGAVSVCGVYKVEKTASVAFLNGGRVYWVRSTSKAHPLRTSGDFYVGVCVKDAAEADTHVYVALNETQRNHIEYLAPDGTWTTEATDGLGVTRLFDGTAQLAFDAVAEVAQAALYSDDKVDVDDGPILESRFAVFDIGDDAALDINVGLASGSHATNFETIAAFVAVQLDGNSLNLNAHSDDGTTDVAPVDTTVDLVDDTYVDVWWDCRDKADCKLYVNGVRKLSGTTFDLSEYASTLVPIAHMEKTNNDTPAELRVSELRVRTSD